MLTQVTLRTATPSDYKEIAQISVAAYHEYAKVLSAENWQRMQQNLLDVEHTAKVADFIVAEIKNEIVGAIAYYPPGKSNPKYFDFQWASLRLLAVDPQHRRKGIGKLLTNEGIERAKDNAKAIALYTSEAMTVAQKMYGSLGFKQVRELPMMLDLRYWLYVLYLPPERS